MPRSTDRSHRFQVAVEKQQRKLRHVVWSGGSLGMQGCLQMRFSLDPKKSTGVYIGRISLPLGQQHKNANANAIETAVANKQLFNKAVSFGPQAPASRSTWPRSADRSRRFQEAVEWQQRKVRHVVWSHGSLGMQLGSQKVKRWSNKQLFSKACLGVKPQLICQLCPTWLTEIKDFRGPPRGAAAWQERKVRHVVWSHGPLGMQLCMEMEFPSVSKSQKVCPAALCFKNVRACLPLGQQEWNANAGAVETTVANKQLISKAVLSHTSPS